MVAGGGGLLVQRVVVGQGRPALPLYHADPLQMCLAWHSLPNKIPGEKVVLWLVLFSDYGSFLGMVIHYQPFGFFFPPPKSFKMIAYLFSVCIFIHVDSP